MPAGAGRSGHMGPARRAGPRGGYKRVTIRLQNGNKKLQSGYKGYNSVTKNRQNAQFWEKIFFNFCARFYLTFFRLCGIMEISGRCVRSRPAIIPQPKAFVNRQKCTKKTAKSPHFLVISLKFSVISAFFSELALVRRHFHQF